MLITTLCYLEHRGHYLMLHRTKKENDINEGKWIGVGGKFKDRESPEECLLREVFEETGFRLTGWRFRGFITFLQTDYETEYMCLYSADGFDAPEKDFRFIPAAEHPAFASEDASLWPVPECSEGELAWIPLEKIESLSLWPGDRIFLRLLREDRPFFSLKLRYNGDSLEEAVLDGVPLNDAAAFASAD